MVDVPTTRSHLGRPDAGYTIKVGESTIEVQDRETPFSHLVITVHDPSGRLLMEINGAPTGPDGKPIVPTWRTPFDPNDTIGVHFDDKEFKHGRRAINQRVIWSGGLEELEEKLATLRDAANQINDKKIGYRALSTNSNAAAGTLLAAIGVHPEKLLLDGGFEDFVFGYGINMLDEDFGLRGSRIRRQQRLHRKNANTPKQTVDVPNGGSFVGSSRRRQQQLLRKDVNTPKPANGVPSVGSSGRRGWLRPNDNAAPAANFGKPHTAAAASLRSTDNDGNWRGLSQVNISPLNKPEVDFDANPTAGTHHHPVAYHHASNSQAAPRNGARRQPLLELSTPSDLPGISADRGGFVGLESPHTSVVNGASATSFPGTKRARPPITGVEGYQGVNPATGRAMPFPPRVGRRSSTPPNAEQAIIDFLVRQSLPHLRTAL